MGPNQGKRIKKTFAMVQLDEEGGERRWRERRLTRKERGKWMGKAKSRILSK